MTCRIQNPDIPRAGGDGAANGGAAEQGGAKQDETPTNYFLQNMPVPLTLQTIEDNSPGRLSGSTNKRIST